MALYRALSLIFGMVAFWSALVLASVDSWDGEEVTRELVLPAGDYATVCSANQNDDDRHDRQLCSGDFDKCRAACNENVTAYILGRVVEKNDAGMASIGDQERKIYGKPWIHTTVETRGKVVTCGCRAVYRESRSQGWIHIWRPIATGSLAIVGAACLCFSIANGQRTKSKNERRAAGNEQAFADNEQPSADNRQPTAESELTSGAGK